MTPNFKWKNHKFACPYPDGVNGAYCGLREKSRNDMGFCTELQCPTFENPLFLEKDTTKSWKVVTYIINSKKVQSTITTCTVEESTLSEIITRSLTRHSHKYDEIKLSITPR